MAVAIDCKALFISTLFTLLITTLKRTAAIPDILSVPNYPVHRYRKLRRYWRTRRSGRSSGCAKRGSQLVGHQDSPCLTRLSNPGLNPVGSEIHLSSQDWTRWLAGPLTFSRIQNRPFPAILEARQVQKMEGLDLKHETRKKQGMEVPKKKILRVTEKYTVRIPSCRIFVPRSNASRNEQFDRASEDNLI